MRAERLENVGDSGQYARVWHFDSMTEMTRALAPSVSGWNKQFTGLSAEQAAERGITGNNALVPEAEKLLSEIQTENLTVPSSHWEPSVAGAFPVVPAFLANDPESMMRLAPASSSRAPIRIFVDLTSSADVSHEQLKRRGIALLAFAMIVSQERPCEFRVATVLDAGQRGRNMSAVVFNIETMPLELATACHALTSQGITRGYGFDWLEEQAKAYGGWAWGSKPDAKYERLSRVAFGIGENDLYIAPMYSDDPFKSPVDWIRKKLARFQERENS